MKIVAKTVGEYELLDISGRIDGLTAAEIRDAFNLAATAGKRVLIADFTNVTYLSSAGLRVLLQTHKSFQKIGGVFILLSVPDSVAEVFRISGLNKLFNLCPDPGSLHFFVKQPTVKHLVEVLEIDGVRFDRLSKNGAPGKLHKIGFAGKLHSAGYHPYDVVRVRQSEVEFAAGIAALGDEYSDFHALFGESLTIGHHFFSYPAVQRPSVDYSFYAPDSGHLLNFLYGFHFTGAFNEILHFDSSREAMTVENLIQAVSGFATTDHFGLVMLCVSGGIMGMHLKRSPVIEFKPADGDIFSSASFPEWMSYAIEEEDINKTIVAVGVAKRSVEPDSPASEILPDEGGMHLHAAVFENGLWSGDPGAYETELNRVVHEFEVEKVVHLLPSSRLKSGFIGIINLETE
jgi:anti-anti-sigma factor